MDSIQWLLTIKSKILAFLAHQKGTIPGYYKYSYSGDIYDEKTRWGLTSTVFAAKILYMLNALTPKDKKELTERIKSFQAPNGEIYDPVMLRHSLIPNTIKSVYNRNFQMIYRYPRITKRGETRQSYAALFCLDNKPDKPYRIIPENIQDIRKFLNGLPWHLPWSAGSHVSHLIFFLHYNHKIFGLYKENYQEMIHEIIQFFNEIQSTEDGFWYRGKINNIQRINGAMKILTGFDVIGWEKIPYIEKIIDLCLKNANDEGACSSFDVLYVLFYCSRITDYRKEEVKEFAKKKIDQYREYFHEDKGGFSFYKNRANNRFCGAKISLGKNEPDIHGTVLYTWGLAVIADILGINNKAQFQFPIT